LRAAFGLSFFVCDGTVITSDMGAALPLLLLGLATGDGRAAGLTRGGVVLTVNADRDVVERQLGDGELACPSCGGVLARWGTAVRRRVRLPGRLDDPDGRVQLVPRRSRCPGCKATHVLLPAWCLARRADAGVVIGLALEAKAAGAGHRVIAERLDRPASTVRGWLRAFTARAEQVRSVFTALAASLVLQIRRCRPRPGMRWRRSRLPPRRQPRCRGWAWWRGGSWPPR